MSTSDTSDPYGTLISNYKQIANIENASYLLKWDQRTQMPSGGSPARSQQRTVLETVKHEKLVSSEMGELLEQIDRNELTPAQQANVREIERQYRRETAVPNELATKVTDAETRANDIWEEAKANDDFESFAPVMKEVAEVHIERAQRIDPDADPYAVLVGRTEPDLSYERIETIMQELKEGLVPLIEEIRTNGRDIETDAFKGSFDESKQLELFEDVLSFLGYDWNRGRLDTSPHPFSLGNQFDARVTTRTDENNLLDGLGGVIHEFGHALYMLGLPQEDYGTPLGEARSSAIHESQSRFWENHVGLSEPFWEEVLPIAKEHFPQLEDVTPREAYESATQVYEDNLIRVDADELTYHLHILVRVETEQAYLNDEITIEEFPELWNQKMEEYLGVRPPNDRLGCLQDVAYTHGFGRFPKFSIGNVFAAQFVQTMKEDLGSLDKLIANREFEAMREWQHEHIHSLGKRYPTDELIEEVTSEPLTAEYFLDYIYDKYESLYDL